MRPLLQFSTGVFGLSLILVAIWQWNVNNRESKSNLCTEEGQISWLLPGRVRRLGGEHGAFLEPRKMVTFTANVTYPKEIHEGHAFQIILESRMSTTETTPEDLTTEDTSASGSTDDAYHEFSLELPGLDVLPEGMNRLGVDSKVRWQIAPPRDRGTYKGYIRPQGGTVAILGGEYSVRWRNPGDLELEIRVLRSFNYIDKLESLIFGFLGSLLSFPALLALYKLVGKNRVDE